MDPYASGAGNAPVSTFSAFIIVVSGKLSFARSPQEVAPAGDDPAHAVGTKTIHQSPNNDLLSISELLNADRTVSQVEPDTKSAVSFSESGKFSGSEGYSAPVLRSTQRYAPLQNNGSKRLNTAETCPCPKPTFLKTPSLPLAAPLCAKPRGDFIPLIALGYGVAYMDRVNIGFAQLQMKDDLHFSSTIFGIGAGIFFVSYAACEIPSNLLLYRFGARRWLARIMLTWGLLAMAHDVRPHSLGSSTPCVSCLAWLRQASFRAFSTI